MNEGFRKGTPVDVCFSQGPGTRFRAFTECTVFDWMPLFPVVRVQRFRVFVNPEASTRNSSPFYYAGLIAGNYMYYTYIDGQSLPEYETMKRNDVPEKRGSG